MFKHILVATDGSKLSQKAVRAAVKLAASHGARLTGLHVMPDSMPPIYGEASLFVTSVSYEDFSQAIKKDAAAALAFVEKQAGAAKVAYAGVKRTASQPWSAIIDTAKARKCDLVVMASHGRKGLSGILLGSETTKVLTHSKVPVLVVR